MYEGNSAAARDGFGKALAMFQAIEDRAGESVTWHNLASLDLREGSYVAARDKLRKALVIKQAIRDRAGEAATWHQLASIDLEEGSYAAARDKLGKALAMHQAIGNRAGEGATFHELGFMAWKIDRREAAIPLVALSFVIKHAIENGDARQACNNLLDMSSQVGYHEQQVADLTKAVAEAYAQDRGRQLLLDAFPELKDTFPA
jgi:tetratricopeptide (TPR) repeat protein